MIHLDLFSGIGGFAYAIDQIWDNVEHIFCDNDKFCRQVIKKHWPDSYIYEDIRAITADTTSHGPRKRKTVKNEKRHAEKPKHTGKLERRPERPHSLQCDILTGGFPCQPFSQAGKRRGTEDNRYLWPEMLRVIQLTKPTWVIAENVRGILTWNEGMVFEQVCTDLEAEGYEVQSFVIPAVAVNAPHRRDRVWFIAHSTEPRRERDGLQRQRRPRQRSGNGENQEQDNNAQNTVSERSRGRMESDRQVLGSQRTKVENKGPSWNKKWIEVATELCSVDDGISVALDRFELSKSAHRKEQLKAYGNAIVPQVAEMIMRAINTQYEGGVK